MVQWPEPTPHEVLGVPPNAALDDVIIAYHRQLAQYRRDPGPKASPEYLAKRPWYIARLTRAYRSLLDAAGGIEPALLDVYWRATGAPIEGFLRFAGLQYGDDASRAIALFGPRFRAEATRSFRMYSFLPDEDGWHMLDVYCNPSLKERITLIRLRRDAHGDPLMPLRARGIADPQLDLLGQPWSAIHRRYGEPHNIEDDLYTYHLATRTDAPLVHVEFTCYSFHDAQCTTIAVTWNALEHYLSGV